MADPDARTLDHLAAHRAVYRMACRFRDAANRAEVPSLQRDAEEILRGATTRLQRAAAVAYPMLDVFTEPGLQDVLERLAIARPEPAEETAPEALD